MRSQITRWAPSSGSSSKARDSAHHRMHIPSPVLQLALINLCINGDLVNGSPSGAILLGIISLSPVVQPLFQRRTINYLPNKEVAGITYAHVVLRMCPWPEGAQPLCSPRRGQQEASHGSAATENLPPLHAAPACSVPPVPAADEHDGRCAPAVCLRGARVRGAHAGQVLAGFSGRHHNLPGECGCGFAPAHS